MKAIIIQDHDARALLDQLKLESMRKTTVVIPGATPEQFDEFNRRFDLWINQYRSDCHGRFHLVVTRWLQEQGANVVR